MKHLGLSLIATLAFTSFASDGWAAKPKMLVQDLVAQGVEVHEAQVISTAACSALSKDAKYDVLCGDDLRNMMRFGALAASFDSCSDETCYTNMGKVLQARFVVSGSVSKLGKTFVLSLSVFDTETVRPVGRTEIKADSIENLHAQAGEAASAILTNR